MAVAIFSPRKSTPATVHLLGNQGFGKAKQKILFEGWIRL